MTAAFARPRETIDADLCVVGAGIVGLAHAHEARRRGLRVALVERDQRAVGASVRNFGHAFVAGIGDGEDLECALRARERWLELGLEAGIEGAVGRDARGRARRGRARAARGRRRQRPSRGADTDARAGW